MAQSKLTPELQDKIIQAIKMGNYVETAVAYAGIHKDSFYTWLQRGKDEPGSIYSDFSDAVEKAKAESEVRDVTLIEKAATDGSWQAAAWKLERKFPQKWGRVTRTEITGAEGKPISVEVDAKTELKKLLGLSDDSDV